MHRCFPLAKRNTILANNHHKWQAITIVATLQEPSIQQIFWPTHRCVSLLEWNVIFKPKIVEQKWIIAYTSLCSILATLLQLPSSRYGMYHFRLKMKEIAKGLQGIVQMQHNKEAWNFSTMFFYNLFLFEMLCACICVSSTCLYLKFELMHNFDGLWDFCGMKLQVSKIA